MAICRVATSSLSRRFSRSSRLRSSPFFHDMIKLVRLDGLGQKIIGAGLQSLHSGFDGAESRENNGGKLRTDGQRLFKKLQAVHLRHTQVGEHDVESLLRQKSQGFCPGRRRTYGKISKMGFQQALQAAGEILFVIHYQDKTCFTHDVSSPLLAATGKRSVNRAPPSPVLAAATLPPRSCI